MCIRDSFGVANASRAIVDALGAHVRSRFLCHRSLFTGWHVRGLALTSRSAPYESNATASRTRNGTKNQGRVLTGMPLLQPFGRRWYYCI